LIEGPKNANLKGDFCRAEKAVVLETCYLWGLKFSIMFRQLFSKKDTRFISNGRAQRELPIDMYLKGLSRKRTFLRSPHDHLGMKIQDAKSNGHAFAKNTLSLPKQPNVSLDIFILHRLLQEPFP